MEERRKKEENRKQWARVRVRVSVRVRQWPERGEEGLGRRGEEEEGEWGRLVLGAGLGSNCLA